MSETTVSRYKKVLETLPKLKTQETFKREIFSLTQVYKDEPDWSIFTSMEEQFAKIVDEFNKIKFPAESKIPEIKQGEILDYWKLPSLEATKENLKNLPETFEKVIVVYLRYLI